MKVIPAIDLMDGKCVRLTEGKKDQRTDYAGDPIEVALGYARDGASLIHVVDLDGAFSGQPVNLSVVEKIAKAVDVPVQFGGGVRTMEDLEQIFSYGVDRVVLGTTAITNPAFFLQACRTFGPKIWVGLDAKQGLVAIKGWEETTQLTVEKLLGQVSKLPVGGVVYTDVARDGKLAGPNLESLKEVSSSTKLPVVASGGISNLDDVAQVAQLQALGVTGVIVGKAIYSGRITLKDALSVWEEGQVNVN